MRMVQLRAHYARPASRQPLAASEMHRAPTRTFLPPPMSAVACVHQRQKKKKAAARAWAHGAEIHTPRVWWLSLCCQTGTVVLAVLRTLLGRGMRFENTTTPPLLFSDSV